jgi:hypothetical protein
MSNPYPAQQYPGGYQPPAPVPPVSRRKPRTGAAISALVLGIVALCGSPIPILNNATIIAGFIAIPFGIVALFGLKRGTAITGLILAVAGIVVGLILQAQWTKQLDKISNDLQTSFPSAPAFPTAPTP